MEAYIYAADLYCEDCGEDIRERIASEGNAPAHPDDEYTYDSDDFPKGPFADGGGESDHPCHCGAGADCLNAIEVDGHWAGAFLENPLTSDGVEYVLAAHQESASEVTRMWMDHYGIVDSEDD